MKNSFESLKSLAKEYAFGAVNITNISKFNRTSNENGMNYLTTKGAFIFPISGSATIRFGDNSFIAERGKMIHGCSRQKLKFEVLENNEFQHINLYYESNNNILLDLKLEDTEKTISTLENIIQLKEKNTLKSIYELEQLLEELFELLFKDCLSNNLNTSRELIKEVVNYIHSSYDKNISLKTLADYAGKRPEQLSYLFYKYMNIRPIDYLIKYRLEQAIELLRENDYTIREVATCVGYSDSLYFSRIFKKHVGYSPSQVKNS